MKTVPSFGSHIRSTLRNLSIALTRSIPTECTVSLSYSAPFPSNHLAGFSSNLHGTISPLGRDSRLDPCEAPPRIHERGAWADVETANVLGGHEFPMCKRSMQALQRDPLGRAAV